MTKQERIDIHVILRTYYKLAKKKKLHPRTKKRILELEKRLIED